MNIAGKFEYEDAHVEIRDLTGRVINRKPLDLLEKSNEVVFSGNHLPSGIYAYSLVVDGFTVATRRLVLVK